ncbi:hypothetical protein BDV12DRAFT_164932 [Aspergillus spectabilis]
MVGYDHVRGILWTMLQASACSSFIVTLISARWGSGILVMNQILCYRTLCSVVRTKCHGQRMLSYSSVRASNSSGN